MWKRPKRKITILTFDVEVDGVADTVALDVVRDAGVDAGLIPTNVLQDETLVADDDAEHRANSKRNILKQKVFFAK